MLITAQQAIDQALKTIGVLGTGTTITAQEYEDSLFALNLMLDSWSISDTFVYSNSSHTFPFIPGQQVYTLGTGGDFDYPRPANVERISVLYPGTGTTPVELPLDIATDLEDWQNITVKDTPSVFPLICYINYSFPLMELNFWPIPNGNASVILYTWDLLPNNLANLTDIIELPQGYSEAVILNLAVKLAQMFDRQPSPQLLSDARQAKHAINDINAGTPTLHYDPLFAGRSGALSMAYKSFGRVVL